MDSSEVTINIYNKKDKVTTSVSVEKISDSRFRMLENDLFNFQLSLGTEFEARLNQEGNYVIEKIIKESDYITRRFVLTPQFKESEYQVLGDEIMKNGGFWQVDIGGIATINLPKNSDLNLNEIFRTFNFQPSELKE